MTTGWTFPRKRPAEQRRAPRPTRVLRGLRASGVTIGRTLVVCRGEAFADGDQRPFAVMQATMTTLYNRPGISG